MQVKARAELAASGADPHGPARFHPSGRRMAIEFVRGPKGAIETLHIQVETAARNVPVIYFLPGWWGAATDYIGVMHHFASLGFNCRSFSWRGTGKSEGNSFWGLGYEADLLSVLSHYADENVVFLAHSGAIDYLRKALPHFQRVAGMKVHAAVFIAPLARTGAMGALLRWLRPDRTGTTIERWLRFLGSNVLGLAWFMRNELALRRVLLGSRVNNEVVQLIWSQIDRCPYGRYFLSLWRFPSFVKFRKLDPRAFGVRHSLVLHSELDNNFTEAQQRDTAEGLSAEFQVLRGACHQWFADEHSFQTTIAAVLPWLEARGIVPHPPGEPLQSDSFLQIA